MFAGTCSKYPTHPSQHLPTTDAYSHALTQYAMMRIISSTRSPRRERKSSVHSRFQRIIIMAHFDSDSDFVQFSFSLSPFFSNLYGTDPRMYAFPLLPPRGGGGAGGSSKFNKMIITITMVPPVSMQHVVEDDKDKMDPFLQINALNYSIIR